MKKKIEFDEVEIGEYFKYYGIVYRKIEYSTATALVKKRNLHKFFFNSENVIPVTVTIKVKEK